jgi:hypothetical protein
VGVESRSVDGVMKQIKCGDDGPGGLEGWKEGAARGCSRGRA